MYKYNYNSTTHRTYQIGPTSGTTIKAT